MNNSIWRSHHQEAHFFHLDFVLLLCEDICICRKPFVRCYVPCGAAKLTSLHPELRSVNDFNFLSTDPRPLSLLCWGEGGQYDEVMSWWGWWSWWWRRCSLWWRWWRWWSRQWFQFSLQTFATVYFVCRADDAQGHIGYRQMCMYWLYVCVP